MRSGVASASVAFTITCVDVGGISIDNPHAVGGTTGAGGSTVTSSGTSGGSLPGTGDTSAVLIVWAIVFLGVGCSSAATRVAGHREYRKGPGRGQLANDTQVDRLSR